MRSFGRKGTLYIYKMIGYRWSDQCFGKEDVHMMTDTKRLEALHERAEKIRLARDKMINRIIGTVSMFCLAAIIVLSTLPGGAQHTIESADEAGSSLLDEGVGGYVLVAVTSFMVAVIITVLCIRWNNRKKEKDPSAKD